MISQIQHNFNKGRGLKALFLLVFLCNQCFAQAHALTHNHVHDHPEDKSGHRFSQSFQLAHLGIAVDLENSCGTCASADTSPAIGAVELVPALHGLVSVDVDTVAAIAAVALTSQYLARAPPTS